MILSGNYIICYTRYVPRQLGENSMVIYLFYYHEVYSYLKGLAQVKIIKKSVILF